MLPTTKRFYSFLGFLCIVAITKNGIDAAPTNDVVAAKVAIEVAKKAIAVSSEAMDLFNKVLDQSVPWKTLEASLNELDRFRKDYSQRAAQLVSNVRTQITLGIETYNKASSSIYKWCMMVEPLLKKYIELFDNIDKSKSAVQKQILVKVLDNGIQEMVKAQKSLGDSSSSFNGAAGQLTTLRHQLSSDFNEQSSYFNEQIAKVRREGYGISSIFGPIGLAIAAGIVEGKLVPEFKARLRGVENFYNNLNGIVSNSNSNIDAAKSKLNGEIRAIGDLKVQTEEMSTYASIDGVTELRDIVIAAAQSLIKKCTLYRITHPELYNRADDIDYINIYGFSSNDANTNSNGETVVERVLARRNIAA